MTTKKLVFETLFVLILKINVKVVRMLVGTSQHGGAAARVPNLSKDITIVNKKCGGPPNDRFMDIQVRTRIAIDAADLSFHLDSGKVVGTIGGVVTNNGDGTYTIHFQPVQIHPRYSVNFYDRDRHVAYGTFQIPPPDPPTNIIAKAIGTGAIVTWKDLQGSILDYRVNFTNGKDSREVPVQQDDKGRGYITVSSLGEYEDWWVSVKTIDCKQDGPYSAPVKFRTAVSRCKLIHDKMDVDENRMYYFLNTRRCFHLLQRLFMKISDHFKTMYTNPEMAYLATKRYIEDPLNALDTVPVDQPLQVGILKSQLHLAVVRVLFLEAEEKTDATTGQPIPTLTNSFLQKFFPNEDAAAREAYFREDWPGGDEAFDKFKRVLLMDNKMREGKQIADKNLKPSLRFLFHGDSTNKFGFIHLWNRESKEKVKYPKDNMLVHLTTITNVDGSVLKPDKFLEYHNTDKCHFGDKLGNGGVHRASGFHEFYSFIDNSVTKSDEIRDGPPTDVISQNNNAVYYTSGNVLTRNGRFYTQKNSKRNYNTLSQTFKNSYRELFKTQQERNAEVAAAAAAKAAAEAAKAAEEAELDAARRAVQEAEQELADLQAPEAAAEAAVAAATVKVDQAKKVEKGLSLGSPSLQDVAAAAAAVAAAEAELGKARKQAKIAKIAKKDKKTQEAITAAQKKVAAARALLQPLENAELVGNLGGTENAPSNSIADWKKIAKNLQTLGDQLYKNEAKRRDMGCEALKIRLGKLNEAIPIANANLDGARAIANDPATQAAIDKAQANLDQAQANLDRANITLAAALKEDKDARADVSAAAQAATAAKRRAGKKPSPNAEAEIKNLQETTIRLQKDAAPKAQILQRAQRTVQYAQRAVENAQRAVENAQQPLVAVQQGEAILKNLEDEKKNVEAKRLACEPLEKQIETTEQQRKIKKGLFDEAAVNALKNAKKIRSEAAEGLAVQGRYYSMPVGFANGEILNIYGNRYVINQDKSISKYSGTTEIERGVRQDDGSYLFSDGIQVYSDGGIRRADIGFRTLATRVKIYPDGRAVHPDGRTVYPDGRIEYPDGRTEYPDGRTVYPDGRAEYPDGRTMYPDGRTVYPDGRTEYPDGRTVYPDGRTVYPDKSVRLKPTNDFRTFYGVKIYNDGWEDSPYEAYETHPGKQGKRRTKNTKLVFTPLETPEGKYKLFDNGDLGYPDDMKNGKIVKKGKIVKQLHRYGAGPDGKPGPIVYSDGLWLQGGTTIFKAISIVEDPEHQGRHIIEYPNGFLVFTHDWSTGTATPRRGGFKKTRKSKRTKRRTTRRRG